MWNSAVPNHAARVLELAASGVPADAALRRYLDGSRRLGPVGSRAVSRAVFATFRWLRWLDLEAPAQRRVTEALALQERFDRDPGSFKAETLAARAVPPWLSAEVSLTPEDLRQLQREPALWLRTRTGRADEVAAALGNCAAPVLPGALCRPGELNLAAWRYGGTNDLFQTAPFKAGSFEIQDLASQLVGHACAPAPGQSWWDVCAGEGGKTLHLCDLLRNKGLVWATDRSERRLTVLRRRTARAGLFNYQAAPWEGTGRLPTGRKFDGVLLDAPCSGVGTWQRNPHARWTTTPEDVRELAGVQLGLLHAVAAAVKPGGRLVYAVCTLTRSETTAVADAFAAAHPEFVPVALPIAATAGDAVRSTPTLAAADPAVDRSPLQSSEGGTAAGGAGETGESHPGTEAKAGGPPGRITLWPHALNANGMFIAAWRKA
jgi:16S rRNA (cytosine967-C5)-methyltransferase